MAAMFLSNWDEKRKHYEGPSIDAPQQILINLDKQFQTRGYFNVSANQKQESFIGPCFLSDQNEMRKLHKETSIDTSCKVWFHLA